MNCLESRSRAAPVPCFSKKKTVASMTALEDEPKLGAGIEKLRTGASITVVCPLSPLGHWYLHNFLYPPSGQRRSGLLVVYTRVFRILFIFTCVSAGHGFVTIASEKARNAGNNTI